MASLLAVVRPIDLAIFATLGGLWIGGVVFIVALYRWIRRYEREQDTSGPDAVEVTSSPTPAPRADAPARLRPSNASVRPLADAL